jgi:endogenous inhibitor of DNA gyrase (YacG/DUF329 family)
VEIEHQAPKRKRAALAAQIEREILADQFAVKPQRSPLCFTCGREFTKAESRFCSDRCRDVFDNGAPPFDADYASKINPRRYRLPIGRHGFPIDCANCRRQFVSKGWRCCSVECERSYRLKQELADQPFRTIKRKCAECGGDIPNWRNGRRVSKATQFCSRRCKDRNGKNARMTVREVNPALTPKTAKKYPKMGVRKRSNSTDRARRHRLSTDNECWALGSGLRAQNRGERQCRRQNAN